MLSCETEPHASGGPVTAAVTGVATATTAAPAAAAAVTTSPPAPASASALCLYRICLTRALHAHYSSSSSSTKQIAIELAAEFRDTRAESSLLQQCSFDVGIYSLTSGMLLDPATVAVRRHKIAKNNRIVFDLHFPDIVGQYRLQVLGYCDRVGGVVLIPLESETFEIVSVIPANSSVLLGAYWKYDILGNKPLKSISIREEFGSTLGSHVWDSALVFTRHLKYCLSSCEPMVRRLAVELGAGCGLAGIALTTESFERVVLTDKECNLPYMNSNIILNNCESIATAETLDWSSRSDIDWFQASNGGLVDLILAADVLYDLEAAIYLFDVIRQLATCDHTNIILGQKIRPVGPDCKRFDISTLADFKADIILVEANVIIWKIVKTS
jgi:predicted nicotinamide N-methyase